MTWNDVKSPQMSLGSLSRLGPPWYFRTDPNIKTEAQTTCLVLRWLAPAGHFAGSTVSLELLQNEKTWQSDRK